MWRRFLCILLGEPDVAVNMNTFVGREAGAGRLYRTGQADQRIGLSFYDVQISFTLLNAF